MRSGPQPLDKISGFLGGSAAGLVKRLVPETPRHKLATVSVDPSALDDDVHYYRNRSIGRESEGSLQGKMHRQPRSAKLPPWECSAARSSLGTPLAPRRAPAPVRLHLAQAPPRHPPRTAHRETDRPSRRCLLRRDGPMPSRRRPHPNRGRQSEDRTLHQDRHRVLPQTATLTPRSSPALLDVLPTCAPFGRAS